MKKLIRILAVLLIATAAVHALPAQADRGGQVVVRGGGRFGHGGYGGGHGGVGVYIGPGWWGPGWAGYPYPYYPYYYYPYYPSPPVVVQPPEIYVDPAPQEETPSYWYFCPDPQGYYPYVKKCPKGWLKVVPPANPPEGGGEK
ncbi:hypothetical protein [Geobacter sp. AOG2]|uniref:hypothetical protein n=1 Tax=Geobacter sp. AOG2 TaxID=1566347 RepID=UPI001CC6905E|nr:hypothetical protein [Geobacter sp. AOG2]GFE62848.1 hypothetical protein AOG2_34370 [Geobacter sp. AOG2]